MRVAATSFRLARAARACEYETMRELLRTNDVVLISAIEALLQAAGIGHYVADSHMSVLEGSIGLLPRRLMVESDEHGRAHRLLAEAGFRDVLVD